MGDYVMGGAGNDVLYVEGLKSQLYGEDGDDSLWGFVNNDLLIGGAGNDTFHGVTGSNTMGGGEGDDMFVFNLWQYAVNRIADFESTDQITCGTFIDLDANGLLDYRDLDKMLDANHDGIVNAADGTVTNGGAGGDVTFMFTYHNGGVWQWLTFAGCGSAGPIDSVSDVVNPDQILVTQAAA